MAAWIAKATTGGIDIRGISEQDEGRNACQGRNRGQLVQCVVTLVSKIILCSSYRISSHGSIFLLYPMDYFCVLQKWG